VKSSGTTFSSKVPYSYEVRKKYIDLPFPQTEYDNRISKIRAAMDKRNLDEIIVFGNSHEKGDLTYVSNFYPFGRTALILGSVKKREEPVIITDGILHGEPINSYIWTTWIRDFRPVHRDPNEFAREISNVLREDEAAKVGIVGMENLPMTIWDALRASTKDTSYEDFWAPFTMIKSVRSPREVDLLKQVGKITAEGMRAAVESIEVDRTEHEIVANANKTMFELGAHELFFSTIVNSGPRGGLKHSYPTDRRIKRGDLIYLDMGASRYGYNSDMSRSVVVGGANKEQKEVLDVILEAYRELTSMMKPGTNSDKIVERAKEMEDKSGLNEKYRGRIFLGLAIHHAVGTSFAEFPTLGFPGTILNENMTFAFEPMAHILDFGTAVIEDMILITKEGADSITPYEKVHW
jgi:Xaa-Pro aminopeptidase